MSDNRKLIRGLELFSGDYLLSSGCSEVDGNLHRKIISWNLEHGFSYLRKETWVSYEDEPGYYYLSRCLIDW
jgi:hypothetical protein